MPIFRLSTQPGYKRDGTELDGDFFNDGQHTRFQYGRPKKMGGYRAVTDTFTFPIRALHLWSKQPSNIIHSFSTSKVEALLVDNTGAGAAVYDRTPVGFVTQDDYSWQVDTMFDGAGSPATRIFAHSAKNGDYIDSSVQTPVWYGTTDSTSALTSIKLTDVNKAATTGGITAGTNTLVLAANVISAPGVAGNTFVTGDLIEIANAGAGGTVPLYTTVTNTVGTTLTLQDNASSTVVAQAVSHIVGCDGGIVTLGPYLVTYGSYGNVSNSDVNQPSLFFTGDYNSANVVGTKIVKGLPIRGGSNAPAALLWSLDSVIKMSKVSSAEGVFRFDTMSGQSSILSSNSVIEYDGVYYWVGIDRFLMFSGVVQELPNTLNANWFFDGLNINCRQRVWAMKVPRYGEIWWFYPRGDATECTHAIIYNVREKTWYDTVLPRSAGYYSQVFPHPIMADTDSTIWQHEVGFDKIDGEVVTAITANFTTSNLGFPTGGPIGEAPQGINKWTRIERLEPDFAQVGDMQISVLTREYANAALVTHGPYTWGESDVRVDVRHQGRQLLLKFESNVLGGDYFMGVPLLHLEQGDSRE